MELLLLVASNEPHSLCQSGCSLEPHILVLRGHPARPSLPNASWHNKQLHSDEIAVSLLWGVPVEGRELQQVPSTAPACSDVRFNLWQNTCLSVWPRAL